MDSPEASPISSPATHRQGIGLFMDQVEPSSALKSSIHGLIPTTADATTDSKTSDDWFSLQTHLNTMKNNGNYGRGNRKQRASAENWKLEALPPRPRAQGRKPKSIFMDEIEVREFDSSATQTLDSKASLQEYEILAETRPKLIKRKLKERDPRNGSRCYESCLALIHT
ncbi:hypothetical protein EJ08DRAFT_702515 [Tothia fuscella]|uniref:Uncharacterized protein n=1 Tax=Tothia fuscella TaxID=1048955 RepID=A0A9P4NGB8_9PEZI|nr:hypothetical protein EJ08DRAFT_702515 [Tothia fuscella]